jgi:hypothetical protein
VSLLLVGTAGRQATKALRPPRRLGKLHLSTQILSVLHLQMQKFILVHTLGTNIKRTRNIYHLRTVDLEIGLLGEGYQHHAHLVHVLEGHSRWDRRHRRSYWLMLLAQLLE